MDASRLIAIVQEYEEIYNLKHPNYSNQQRRDNIWEEIGNRLNQTGKFIIFYLITYTTEIGTDTRCHTKKRHVEVV